MTFAQSILAMIIMPILSVIVWLIIIEIILGWVIAFGIADRGGMVAQIRYGLSRFTDPILDPFRRIIPPMGGLDLSPIAAILLIGWFNQYVLGQIVMRMLG
ncbi:YggT family protein [Algimonas porphyrae]|uniref:YggT family protein n=1 Tax=Algimonas porphyrae TaxID=1128113 RepID=A0ABQ5UZL5_9PROT|nr:YggT family protein [Algimonas porphyrae]GLQ20162.1 YggT family protein [Algimonas porphyrae]